MAKLPLIGWREWVGLPDFGIDQIKCKVDSGARTSALHAFHVEYDSGKNQVQFDLHPVQLNTDIVLQCVANVVDQRVVTDSGGTREMRYVIASSVRLGDQTWPIELTLTDRDTMRFRMLLGRSAFKNRYLVDAGSSYLIGKYQSD